MSRTRFKVSRRIGENVWFKKKLTSKQKAVVSKLKKRVAGGRRQSDYLIQLINTNKLSIFYALRGAISGLQHSSNSLVGRKVSSLFRLETRLDILLIRANFCSTLTTARQWIAHGKICVNREIVSFAGFLVAVGDIISVKQNKHQQLHNPTPIYSIGRVPQGATTIYSKGGGNDPYIYKELGATTLSLSADGKQQADPASTPKQIIKLRNRYLTTGRAYKSSHIEVNYKTLNIVLLYEPSQVIFPTQIDLDLVSHFK